MANYHGPNLAAVVSEFAYEKRPKVGVPACPICASSARQSLREKDRYGFPQPTILCMNCGLVYLDPVLTQGGYQRLYKSYYRRLVSGYWKRMWGIRKIVKDQKSYGNSLAGYLEKYLPSRPPHLRMLDVGGSAGMVSGEIIERCKGRVKIETTILDPSPDELAHARKKGFRVLQGMIEDTDKIKGPYDLILLCRTIDHLYDPRAALTRMRQMLTKQGLLYIDYVDFGRYARKGRITLGVQIDHICNFSGPNFYPLMEQTGFRQMSGRFAFGPEIGHLFRRCRPKDKGFSKAFAREMSKLLPGCK